MNVEKISAVTLRIVNMRDSVRFLQRCFGHGDYLRRRSAQFFNGHGHVFASVQLLKETSTSVGRG